MTCLYFSIDLRNDNAPPTIKRMPPIVQAADMAIKPPKPLKSIKPPANFVFLLTIAPPMIPMMPSITAAKPSVASTLNCRIESR